MRLDGKTAIGFDEKLQTRTGISKGVIETSSVKIALG
jgi:hypothetical protein